MLPTENNKYQRDKVIEPYDHIKQELPEAEGLIFKQERITARIQPGTSWEDKDKEDAARQILVPLHEKT